MRVAVLLSLLAATGCKQLECGENTIERDGECVAMVDPPGVDCGPGTFYDPESGVCLSGIFEDAGGICGEFTTQITDDAGNKICVGTGGGADCSRPLVCPTPVGANTVSLCGRIFDLEDSTPLDDADPNNGEPARTVELRLYEPIGFATDPGNSPIRAKALPDECGRFVFASVVVPNTGFLATAVEDLDSNADGIADLADDRVLTGVAVAGTAGQVISGVRAFTLRRTTDALWSTAAGLSGTTFGTSGVYVPIFVDQKDAEVGPFPGTPQDGVVTTILNEDTGNLEPFAANDFYFDDTTALERKVVSQTRSATGTNGTGLYLNQPNLSSFSGIGSEPASCTWPTDPGAAPVGVAFVQERIPRPENCTQ
jgi:hypothetical protein